MERFNQRENFLLGYAAQRSFEGPRSLPNIDFNDVFGGPPRRFSLQESTRYSSDGSMDSDEAALLCRLSSKKPVFGEESSSSSSSRKHHQRNDFFDDIFQGDKSCGSPRRGFLNSLPGLQIVSPPRPLPPKSEPLGSSIPAQFSLPATLNKAMNYPTFGSSSSFKQKEVATNGIISPNSLLSRFSSESTQGNDDFRNNAFSSNCLSPLSNEFSNAESSNVTKSNETDMRGDSKGDLKVTEAPTDINQFHFSVYKWSSEGVPLGMPPHEEISSKIDEKDKLKRCFSSNGRIRSDNAYDKENHNISVSFEVFEMESEKLGKTNTLKIEACHIVEEDVLINPKPEVLEIAKVTVENFPEMSSSEKTEKKNSMDKEEACKTELKSLRSILQDEIERLDNEDIIMKRERKQNAAKTAKASRSNAAGSQNVKHEGKRINSDRVEVNKASIPGSPKIPGGNLKRSGVRGKVKDFAKIFNQGTYSKSKSNACNQSQSCRWEGKVAGGEVNEASFSTTEMNFLDMNKMPDSFFMVNETVEKPEKRHSHMKSKIHTSTDNSYNQKEASQFSESIPDGSKVTSDKINDTFQENYLLSLFTTRQIQDLSDDQVKLPQTSEDLEATKALDVKILKWSTGKTGNIRSLLSTLQYVLWAESGWNPVPLVNIIEGNVVKIAYQKALLCLHPDKLQQKGGMGSLQFTWFNMNYSQSHIMALQNLLSAYVNTISIVLRYTVCIIFFLDRTLNHCVHRNST